jgi:hypothetical protein
MIIGKITGANLNVYGDVAIPLSPPTSLFRISHILVLNASIPLDAINVNGFYTGPSQTGLFYQTNAQWNILQSPDNVLPAFNSDIAYYVNNQPNFSLSNSTTTLYLNVAFPQSAQINNTDVLAGGSGYQVNDVLTIDGGTFIPFNAAAQNGGPCELSVTSVDANGAVTGIEILGAGTYTTLPSQPNSPTGGSGTGASVGNFVVVGTGGTATADIYVYGEVFS